MINTKKTILYERLSREDERENESVSIEYQKEYLEDYATRNGFPNIFHLTDDGWSGTRWDRPGFLKMMDEVESGNVGTILIKDMSRLGRDHLRVGLFLEQIRDKGVRLIAVAESIDTAKGEDDFMPFRNLISEWHARDTSKKIRAIFGARTAQGKHVTGAAPYGYIPNPNDRQTWLLDEDAAPVVQRIYQSVINGKGVTQIADELAADGILTPTAHWNRLGIVLPGHVSNADPVKWTASAVIQILSKEEYMGWAVLNKTIKENYKSKRRQAKPEEKLIFKNAHPQIIDEETWNIVQRLRETKRIPQRVGGEANPLTGVLYCSDCGRKLYNKLGKADSSHKPHNEYVCSSYRHYSRSCTYHYIRTEVVEKLILEAIRRVSGYVRQNEAEFVERVRQESVIQQEAAVKENRKKLAKAKRRREEISGLVKKLYESYAADKIPENHFTDLLKDYDGEQTKLDGEIERLQAEIDRFNTDSMRADKFIELVKRHTEFTEFSAALLNEFIEKVIVHEPEKINGTRTQKVDIYLNFIGNFALPEWEETRDIAPTPKGSKKLRRDMTEEELRRAREIDHERYAKKVAAKKAAEEAQRAAILQGTPYEVQPTDGQLEQAAS